MQYERIDFLKNWNNKLLCDIFVIIRPVNKKYSLDQVVDIRIDDKFFSYAKVLKSEIRTLNDIIASGMFLLDSGMNEKDFRDFINELYSKKSWWKNEDTELKIIFFKKITQLTIFEDGNYPIAT